MTGHLSGTVMSDSHRDILPIEQSLLGAILSDNKAHEQVVEFLRPEHFLDPGHGLIYETICTMREKGATADYVTLAPYLRGNEAIEKLGGPQYLADIAMSYITALAVEDYGKQILDFYKRRELCRIAREMENAAAHPEPGDNAQSQIEQAERDLFELASTGDVRGGAITWDEAAKKAIENAEIAFKRDTPLSGVSTGLTDLDRKLGGLHKSDLIIVAGRPSMGKAQTMVAKVLTSTGWKLMGQISLGDELASIDGKPSRVSGIFPQGVKQIYRVTFSDGRSTECCAEHLWKVYYREWEDPRVLPTSRIAEMLQRQRYKGRIWIDMFEGSWGHTDPLPIEPWVLGALLGNGYFRQSSVKFSTNDYETLGRLLEKAGDDFIIGMVGKYDYALIQVNDRHRQGIRHVAPNQIRDALKSLGIWECLSYQKFIPDLYLTASKRSRIELLRGLIDTDGWVEKHGTVRYGTASERLARDIQSLVRSLGGICTIAEKTPYYTYKGERKQGRTAYICNILHVDKHDLVALSRKKDRAVTISGRQNRLTFESIEPTRMAEAQCIAVTHPDRLYITDDYIVTHNTALATNIAFDAVKNHLKTGGKEGAWCAFFSLEMSADQLATRVLADEAQVPSEKIRRGDLQASDFTKFAEATMRLKQSPLYIDDTAALSIGAVRTRAHRIARKHGGVGTGMIVVDYIGLLRGSEERRGGNRVQEVQEITMGLKALAKELNAPVLALSQLSRAVEQREDKRPQLADLRESGSIEQDADVVMFVFREQYYLERAEPTRRNDESDEKFNDRYQRWQQRCDEVFNTAEVIIAKQRHGPIGSVRLKFDGQYTKFSDLETQYDEDGVIQ